MDKQMSVHGEAHGANMGSHIRSMCRRTKHIDVSGTYGLAHGSSGQVQLPLPVTSVTLLAVLKHCCTFTCGPIRSLLLMWALATEGKLELP